LGELPHLTIEGVYLVQLRERPDRRNQVFVDRSRLFETIQRQGEDGGQGAARQLPYGDFFRTRRRSVYP
jgi:hypothetical protein